MSLEEKIAAINASITLGSKPKPKPAPKPSSKTIALQAEMEELKEKQILQMTVWVSNPRQVAGGYLVDMFEFKTKGFLPSSHCTLYGLDVWQETESFPATILKVSGKSNVVLSGLSWLRALATQKKSEALRQARDRNQVFEGEILRVLDTVYIVSLGETEDGLRLEGGIKRRFVEESMMYDPRVGDMLTVRIAYIDPNGRVSLRLLDDDEVLEEKGGSYKPPKKPELKDAPDPIAKMGASSLRKHLESLCNRPVLPVEERMSLTRHIQRRADWPTRSILRGNANWYEMYQRLGLE